MILVTGGTGLAGSFVIEQLVRTGHRVRALVRGDAVPRFAAGVQVARGDLGDAASLRAAADGVDGIVHSACTFRDAEIDIAAMQALLAEWRSGPFVFISSLDVYGFSDAAPITEDTPVTEAYTEYGRGKVICERLLADAARRAGRTDWVALRAPLIWGPHRNARDRLVDKRLRDHQPIILPGADEAEWRQYQDVWIDARDLATIVARSLDEPAGGPLNALTGHFAWHDVYAELIRLTASGSRIVHKPLAEITDDELPRKELYAQRWQFSERRLGDHLGPIPRLPLEVTLRDTVG